MKERITYKGFNIDRTETGYRISKCDNPEVHTHLQNINPSYKLIDNVLSNKMPRRCNCYYLEYHARLSDDTEYIRHIEEYIEVKQSKSNQKYFNPHKKKF